MRKKQIGILAIIMICCFMCACGKEPTCSYDGCEESIYKNDLCKKHYQEDTFIGTWFAAYERQEEDALFHMYKGDKMTCTIEIYKGGTGRIYETDKGKITSDVTLEWQVNDDSDVLTLDYSIGGYERHEGYEYNDTDKTLTNQSVRYIVFTKQ